MKKFNMKKLSVAVATAVMTTFSMPTAVQASDIEIYQEAKAGETTLMFMLDISGSMTNEHSYPSVAAAACDLPADVLRNVNDVSTQQVPIYGYDIWGRRVILRYENQRVRNTTESEFNRLGITRANSQRTIGGVTYTHHQCIYNNKIYDDRISKLKEAMLSLLAGNESEKIEKLADNLVIGLSTLGANNGLNITKSGAAVYYHGAIKLPARKLSELANGKTHRQILMEEIARIEANSATPTARSFAETVAYLMGTNAITGYNDLPSGFNLSVVPKSGNNYIAPESLTSQIKKVGGSTVDSRECSSQGVYVLTDGQPSNDTYSQYYMKAALNTTQFTCPDDSTFDCTKKMSEIILNQDSPNNPSKVSIKTAVVGFGNDFSAGDSAKYDSTLTKEENFQRASNIVDPQVRQAAEWGIIGGGGWYSGNNSADVVNSVQQFIKNLKTDIPTMTTGSPTIPQDPLNRFNIRSEAYYAEMSPMPHKPQQLWTGNMNKYKVINGVFLDADNKAVFNEEGVLNATAKSLWEGGSKNKVPLLKSDKTDSERILYTDRNMTNKNTADTLQKITLDALYDTTFSNNVDKRIALLNLLGYNVSTDVARDELTKQAQLRQLGATLHSTPVLLTQEGVAETQADINLGAKYGEYTGDNKTAIDSKLNETILTAVEVEEIKRKLLAGDAEMIAKYGNYTTDEEKAAVDARLERDLNTKKLSEVEIKDIQNRLELMVTAKQRKDYIMYGSTQGLLHIVDAKTGKERMAFVPNEMIENQSSAFKSEDSTTGGKSQLFYGIDAPWTVYSQYIEKNGVFTVNDPTLKYDQDFRDNGLQWVYGGLRMGGRSYYALDLSQIHLGENNQPKLKFSIQPSKAATGTPLSYMGQSWSKPTIGYVNWKGKQKLVMIVGGGYDSKYEDPAYSPTGNEKTLGAGVYMFDANNGDLLWWTSSHILNSTDSKSDPNTSATRNDDLKYSVVSEILALDVNNDGSFDNLYFGDLGGQAFRVDINNLSKVSGGFARVTRIFADRPTDKIAPRFYYRPSVSVHSGDDGNFIVVAMTSGDRSSPLAGNDTLKGTKNTQTAQDSTYVFYDNDVLRAKWHSDTSLTPRNASATTPFANLNLSTGTPLKSGNGYNIGWKYTYPAERLGQFKGISNNYAVSNILFADIYNRDGDGISRGCGAGVRGNTRIYNFCLPFGNCTEEDHGSSSGNMTDPSFKDSGAGINNSSLSKDENVLNIAATKGKDLITDPCIKNPVSCQFLTDPRFVKLRWYETK